MPRSPELGDGIGRGEVVAAGDDEVGLEGDDLLDVDAVEGGHDRQVVGLGRVGRDVLDLGHDAVTGAEGEEGLGGGRGERDDGLGLGSELDLGAFVVGEGDREGRRWRRRGGRGGYLGRRRVGRDCGNDRPWPAGGEDRKDRGEEGDEER